MIELEGEWVNGGSGRTPTVREGVNWPSLWSNLDRKGGR